MNDLNHNQRVHIRRILIKWKTKVHSEMVVLDSELALRNGDFMDLFEDLIKEFRNSCSSHQMKTKRRKLN